MRPALGETLMVMQAGCATLLRKRYIKAVTFRALLGRCGPAILKEDRCTLNELEEAIGVFYVMRVPMKQI